MSPTQTSIPLQPSTSPSQSQLIRILISLSQILRSSAASSIILSLSLNRHRTVPVPPPPLCDRFLELDNEVLPGRLTNVGPGRTHVPRCRAVSPQLLIGHSAQPLADFFSIEQSPIGE